MTLAILDLKGTALREISLDVPDPTAFHRFIVKNLSSDTVSEAKIRIRDAGLGISDASFLGQRTSIQLSFTRQSSGVQETQYIGVSPIALLTEIEEELEGVLLNGWLQHSVDTFRWASQIIIGPLKKDEFIEVYSRYARPIAEKSPTYIFKATLRNIGSDTFGNVTLTRQGSDLLSVNGSDFTESINLGYLNPGSVAPFYVKTSAIASRSVQAKIEALSGLTVDAEIAVNVPSYRALCSIDEVRRFLEDIDVDVVTSDEEIRRLTFSATNRIEEETGRNFDITSTTERYEDPGAGKLILRNWPIIEVSAVRLYDHSNNLIKELKSTDTDFSQCVIADKENGFLELPVARQPLYTASDIFRWRAEAGAPSEWPRLKEFRRATSVVAWIEVDYTYGYQVIPAMARETCMKIVAMHLLAKKGASDSQGVSALGITGLTETWGQGTAVYSGPFGSLLGQLNTDIERNLSLLQARRGVAVSIV